MQSREGSRSQDGARRYPSAPSLIEYLAVAAIGIKWIVTGHLLGADAYPPYRAPVLTTFAILAVMTWLLLWRPPRWRRWFALGLDALASVLVLVDLWYERFYGEVPTVADVPQIANVAFILESLSQQIRWYDIFVVADLVVLLLLVRRVPLRDRPVRRAAVLGLPAAAVGLGLPAVIILALDADTVFSQRFQRNEVVGALGIPGYHLFDTAEYLAFPVVDRLATESDEREEAERQIRRRRLEELASPMAGVTRGRNVILVSAESLQAFVLNTKIDGRELTPNLNAFARESLSFTDIYDQTHLGTTAEAEFMVLASRLPLASGVVATRYYSNRFRAMPHAMAAAGYQTLSGTAEPPSFWNMRQMHAALGFSRSAFLPDFKYDEWVGVGINDASFFQQMTAKLQRQREPFMAYLLTSSNHHPYRLPPHLQVPEMRVGAGTVGGDYLKKRHVFRSRIRRVHRRSPTVRHPEPIGGGRVRRSSVVAGSRGPAAGVQRPPRAIAITAGAVAVPAPHPAHDPFAARQGRRRTDSHRRSPRPATDAAVAAGGEQPGGTLARTRPHGPGAAGGGVP